MYSIERASREAGLPMRLRGNRFEGYASIFGRPDLAGDVVLAGAFGRALRGRSASTVRMLFQHDPLRPVGVWQEIKEDTRGLFVRGVLLPEVQQSRELGSLLCAGAVDGLSIGFKTRRARQDRRSGLRQLIEVDLWEISIVTFPMLPEARVHALKTCVPPASCPVIPSGSASAGGSELTGRMASAARILRACGGHSGSLHSTNHHLQ
ncbi:MAG: HK97 family phage prohead protease [Pseudomonadota bacterium]